MLYDNFRFQLVHILCMLILINICRCENWVGSKLGTTQYNKELAAIHHAKIDYIKAIEDNKRYQRKSLLCVTFIKPSLNISSILYDNVVIMRDHCDWAIVMYDGEINEIDTICSHNIFQSNLVLCERSKDSFNNHKLSIPKTVLYQTLLPVLPKYHHVFLMDEDIGLHGFNPVLFLSTSKCAFTPRPLIIQPLIAESNQYLLFVNEKPWREGQWNQVVASEVGYIEQQVPMFDSIFFTWFIKQVLSRTKTFSLAYGIDWGHDRSWCNAAKMYAREVLGWTSTSQPCALITSHGTSVHHLNKMTMQIIRGNVNIFRKHAFLVVQKYVDLFPTWVGMDMLEPNNPLSVTNANNFRQVINLNQTCLLELS